MAGSFTFANPVLGLKGNVDPAPGFRLQTIEIALADTPVYAELGTFKLVTADDREYAPIAVGGAGYSMFPVDKLPFGREVGQVLPTDAILAMTRNSATSVLLDAGPKATGVRPVSDRCQTGVRHVSDTPPRRVRHVSDTLL